MGKFSLLFFGLWLLFLGNVRAQQSPAAVPQGDKQLGTAGEWGGTDVGSGLTYTWVQDAFSAELGKTEGNSWTDKKGHLIYKKPEVPPEFVGGVDALNSYIHKNLKIPRDVEIGTVYVAFVVGSDGTIRDAKIVRGMKESIGPGGFAVGERHAQMGFGLAKWQTGRCHIRHTRGI